jgi:hypothetical protein
MLTIGFIALPIAKTHVQVDYKPVSELKVENFNVYSLDYVAPEVIYNYGHKIPSITTSEGYILPEDKQFCLLTNKVDPETVEQLSGLYEITYLETYDLNTSSKDTRGYKSRLVNKLYKFTRR